jgi:acetyl esterase/lipase
MRNLRSRLFGLAVAAVALAGCESTFFSLLNAGPTPDGVVVERNQAYEETGEQLDVYRPDTGAAAPIVVFFYGGRWQGGSRREYSFVGKALASRGIVAVLPDYREYPAVRFPVFVEDAARAVAWARAHAAANGGDPRRLFVAGHSAGAHIAALIGTDARYLSAVGLAPRDLAGVIAIAGPHDFLPITDADIAEIFGPPERYPQSQPINFVDGDEPPFLLLHGRDDDLVRPRESESLAAKLQAAGVPCELRIYPDVGHIRILAAMDLSYRRLAPTLDDVAGFVARTRAGATQ